MKTLYLVRHAKSSWDAPGVKDFDRPLNKRGLRDAAFMGKLLAGLLSARGAPVGLILTSPAKRAAATAGHFADALGMAATALRAESSIYEASPATLHELIYGIEDTIESAMLVGHNPGMTQLAGALSPTPITHMPTCSIVALRFGVDSWQRVQDGTGTLEFFEKPGNHPAHHGA